MGRWSLDTAGKKAICNPQREALGETNPSDTNTSILDVHFPELWENKSGWLSHAVWCFVMGALVN